MRVLLSRPSRVRRATPGDVPRILAMARGATGSIGFLTGRAVREYVGRGGVLVVTVDGEGLDEPVVVGFAVWRLSHGRRPAHRALPAGRHVKLIQVLVLPTHRGEGRGRDLVAAVARAARRRRCEFVSLWCGDDLPANHFYHGLGFRPRGSREGGAKRRGFHNLWVLPLR